MYLFVYIDEQHKNPFVAASKGYIDDVISPTDTRIRLLQDLEMLLHKTQRPTRKKH
jgi:acetyl-CoA carboxylase carboxyltransferase component